MLRITGARFYKDLVPVIFLFKSKWGIKYGKFWAIQWVFDGWISLGIHIDFKHRSRSDGITFGPYIDLHLIKFIVSLGWNPAYSTDLEKVISVSRGGLVE